MGDEVNSFLTNSTSAEKKSRRVPGTSSVMGRGAKPDIDDHFAMLRREFVGRTELELYHALLTVLIRRKIDLHQNVERMQSLWSEHASFLCQNLNSRWLRGMCDTMMDHWPNERERALAAAGTLFSNTIKLYETERYATNGTADKKGYRVQEDRLMLHDGLSGFAIGRGDMIANMYRRVRQVCDDGSIASQILLEMLRRANQYDTVFRRFAEVHVNDQTRW